MASSFKGWGSSWAQTWDRISNPNAMYGSVTIRFTATGAASASESTGSISGSASIQFVATGSLTHIGVQQSDGGGGGAHGVDGYKQHKPKIVSDSYEDDLRAEIITQDDEILAVIMSAVTCGALR